MALEGTVALVTGAANRLGLPTVKQFAGLGAHVVLSDIDPEKGESEAAALRAAGHSARFVQADVSDCFLSSASPFYHLTTRGKPGCYRSAPSCRQIGRNVIN